ncbi:MAG: outer membrane protein transport protein [Nitrospirota bacterium]|nr:MAG: outer membrane protein transport protein [Nitrospirota bacterium]
MYTNKRAVPLLIIIAILACFIITITANEALAFPPSIASPLNAVGSGARAAGMGGAFIGVADDATAASWNPGGLIQLETPEISVVYSNYNAREDYTWSSTVVGDISSESSAGRLNYMSAAYPFNMFDRNLVVSVNYQHIYDLNNYLDHNTSTPNGAGCLLTPCTFDELSVSDQTGGLYTISPALSAQVTPSFSFGMTFNIWQNIGNDNGWDKTYSVVGSWTYPTLAPNPYILTDVARTNHEYTFSGFNMHIGFLWDINEIFTIGGVYKTPFRADIEHSGVDFHEQFDNAGGVFPAPTVNPFSEKGTMELPASYGIGIAARFSDNFTMDLDVYQTNWADFKMNLPSTGDINPVTGLSTATSSSDPTTQVRLGAEYLFIRENTVIPVRAGAFYDPEPREGEPDKYYGFSFGSGFMWKDLVMDAAYQYRWGSDVKEDIAEPGSTADVVQHLVLVSAIYHF